MMYSGLPQLLKTRKGEAVMHALKDGDVAVLKMSWASMPDVMPFSYDNTPMEFHLYGGTSMFG